MNPNLTRIQLNEMISPVKTPHRNFKKYSLLRWSVSANERVC